MKKIIKSIFAVALGAAAFASCEVNPDANQPQAGEQTVEFISEEIGTRSTFTAPEGNTYPVLWTAKDTLIKVTNNLGNPQDVKLETSTDGRTSRFEVKVNSSNETNLFYALAPQASFVGLSTKNPSWTINIPTSQTPSELSVDPLAQILVAKSEKYGAAVPESCKIKFDHAIAYGKLTLTDLNLAGSELTGVTLLFEVNVAGRWNYYLAKNGEIEEGQCTENSSSNVIAVKTTSASDIWFGLAPVDMSGKKLTVIAKTSSGTYTKAVTFPADRKFQAGKIAIFSVNMADAQYAAQKKYALVKDVNDLTVGSRVIIAAAKYNYAISTTQNSNNRSQAAIEKQGENIVDPNTDVEVFEVEAGASEGSIALNATVKKGYIYAAGGTSGNYLRTQDAKDATSSWKVSITDTGIATVKCANDAVTRGLLRYNTGGLFSCYSSGQQDVVFYKDLTPGTVKDSPELKLENTSLTVKVGESAEIGIESCKSDGAVTYTSSDEAVATVDQDGMVSGVASGSAIITVKVAETDKYKAAAATCSVNVVPATEIKIADVIAGEDGLYNVNNVSVKAVEGGNIVIGDDSACMLLYKYDSGLNPGDIININGYTKVYNGVKEFYGDASHNLAITKVSSGTAVHGTPATMAESDFEAFASSVSVKYVTFTTILPVTGTNAKVGAQTVNLYGTVSDKGRYATVNGYTIGYNKSSKITAVVMTNYNADFTKPFISVDNSEKNWKDNETDAFSINVTCENGSWTYEAKSMDWANIAVEGNVITVTPKAANTGSSTNEGTITVKHLEDEAQCRIVTLKQYAPAGNFYKLTSDDIKKAHSSSWSYSSGAKTITAADGSTWICNNNYASANQVTIQMKPGNGGYVLSPKAPAGKKISKVTAVCSTNNSGTTTTGVTRTLDVTDADGTAILTAVKGDDLTKGQTISGTHSQIKIAPNANAGGTVYIVSITIDFE